MIIRDALAEDVKEIIAIDKQVLHSRWHAVHYLSEINREGSMNFVIDDQAIIAYICIRVADDMADLLQIAVMRPYQRQGLGRWLMDYSIARLMDTDVKNLFLEVEVTNQKSCYFYKAYGFEDMRIRSNYYGLGRDAMVMRKRLK